MSELMLELYDLETMLVKQGSCLDEVFVSKEDTTYKRRENERR